MSDFDNKTTATGTEKFHETVSRNALSMWGMQDVAYVRRGTPAEKELWIICAAEGTKLLLDAGSAKLPGEVVKLPFYTEGTVRCKL